MLGRKSYFLRSLSKRFLIRNYVNPNAIYYEILGVREGSSYNEIKEAFNKKCQSLNIEFGPEGFKNAVH